MTRLSAYQPRKHPGTGRPAKTSDQQFLEVLPATTNRVAEVLDLAPSHTYDRLRRLEAEGTVTRDRARSPHLWSLT